MTTSAARSSTTKMVSRNTRTRSGTSRPSSASRPSASAVSVDIATPHPCALGAAGVDGQVDQHWDDHADEAGRAGQHEPPPLPQVAQVELAPRLQADDEEEQRHQSAVDPGPQVVGDLHVAEADREARVPERLVARESTLAQTSASRPRPAGRRRCRTRSQERAQRRRPVARPRRALAPSNAPSAMRRMRPVRVSRREPSHSRSAGRLPRASARSGAGTATSEAGSVAAGCGRTQGIDE